MSQVTAGVPLKKEYTEEVRTGAPKASAQNRLNPANRRLAAGSVTNDPSTSGLLNHFSHDPGGNGWGQGIKSIQLTFHSQEIMTIGFVYVLLPAL